VDVSGLASGVTTIAAGGYHTCVLTANGRAKCWGSDSSGQLGTGRILQRLTPVDVLASAPAALLLNYSTGQPDSYFTLYGDNFTPGSALTATVNSQVLSSTLTINSPLRPSALTVSESGEFIVFLTTTGADEGGYHITATAAGATASATLFVLQDAPLRVQEGGGQTLDVPAGIGIPLKFVYLPLIVR
jgi:alpha-tubulin suppressor-like RCC1 family protein